MRNLIYLFVILLSTSGWNQSFAQESFQQEFENMNTFPILIMRGNEVLDTIGSQLQRTITVREGDRITVNLPDNLDFGETALYGVEPIYISKYRNDAIQIRMLKRFSEFEQRKGHKALFMASNFKGVDLAKYDQLAVAKSFSEQPIFENLGTHAYAYKFQAGEVLPIGFDYTGDDNDRFGSDQVSSYSSARKFEEGFSVGVAGEAPVPGTPVTVGLGVGYSESKQEGSGEDDIYFSNFSGIEVYTVNLYEDDLVNVLLTRAFRKAVTDLKSQDEVKVEIIKRFGTHYPKSVTYGGYFRSWKHISSKDYYEMERQGVDVSASVKVATPTETKTMTNKNVNKQGSGFEEAVQSTSGGAQGNAGFNFSHVQQSEYRDKLSKSKGDFRAVGGPGDHATAIKTELIEIHNLVYPHIFKDGSTENDLRQKREWIRDAVKVYLEDELPKMSPPVPTYKLYKARLSRAKKVDKNLDDANQKMMGSIILKEPGTSNEYPLWKEDEFVMINEASGELKLDINQPWTIIKVPIIDGAPKDITINAEINLVNLDDCCGNDPHIGSVPIRLKDIDGIKDFTKKVTHTAFFEETTWEVKFVIQEIPDLDDQLRTAITKSATTNPVKYSRRSSSITGEEFMEATKAVVVNTGSPAGTTPPVITDTTSTPPKDDFIDLNGTYYITDAKHNKSLVTGMVYGGGVYHQTLRNSPEDASWYLLPTGDGYYYIYDLRFNKALAGPDYYNHLGGGTHFVYHQEPDGRTNAQWKITPSDVPGKYIITDRKHNQSLVAGDVADNNIYLQPHNNRQNAYWTFTATKDKAPAIKPNPNATATTTPATTTVTAKPATNTVAPASPGLVRILSIMGMNNYFHHQNNKLEAGQIQADWSSSQWKLVPVEGGLVRIQNSLHPDKYLHIQNDHLELGTIDLNWTSALWKIVPAQPGVIRIQSSLHPDKYFLNQGGDVMVSVVDFSSYSGAIVSSMWKIEGEIPSTEPNTPTTTAPATATPVSNTMTAASPGYVRLQNYWKKSHYVHNQNGTLEDGLIEPNWWSSQWKIVPVHSGWVRIQNKWKPDQYLHNQNGKLEVGTIDPNWASAMWKLVPAPHNGWVRIQNSWYQNQYIHNQNGKIEVGEIDTNWGSALWKVE